MRVKKINLRDIYPFYQTDVWIKVDEEIVQEMRRFELLESAYKLRAYRHRAYYSLDRNDGIENDILFPSRSTETEYEEMAFRIFDWEYNSFEPFNGFMRFSNFPLKSQLYEQQMALDYRLESNHDHIRGGDDYPLGLRKHSQLVFVNFLFCQI